MAENNLLKRFLDAGMSFTAMTQSRAEAIVKDLVKAGEVQTDQAQQTAQELLERSRANTERLLDQVRKEVKAQVANLGLATQDDIARLERKIGASGSGRSTAKRPAKRAKKAAKRAKKAAKKS